MSQKQLQVGDMAGVDIKIFQFFFENRENFGGKNLTYTGVEVMFFGFFLNGATQRGVVWDITLVENENFLEKILKSCNISMVKK